MANEKPSATQQDLFDAEYEIDAEDLKREQLDAEKRVDAGRESGMVWK